jgi:hypothetical protein
VDRRGADDDSPAPGSNSLGDVGEDRRCRGAGEIVDGSVPGRGGVHGNHHVDDFVVIGPAGHRLLWRR